MVINGKTGAKSQYRKTTEKVTEKEETIMTAKWMLYTKKADFQEIANQYQITPVTARIMRNRDVVGEDAIWRYLHGTMKDLHSP